MSRLAVERVACQAPEAALQRRLRGDRALWVGLPGTDRERRSWRPRTERRAAGKAAHRLAQRLCAQVGGADRVGVVDDRGAPRVVPADGHREAEGEDEADEREQRRLDDAERLAQGVSVTTQRPPGPEPEDRRSEHDARKHQCQLPTTQREKQRLLRCESASLSAPLRAQGFTQSAETLPFGASGGPVRDVRTRGC